MICVLHYQVKVKATRDRQKVALNQREIRRCPEPARDACGALRQPRGQDKEYKQNQLPRSFLMVPCER
jgi:hypothetical protein